MSAGIAEYDDQAAPAVTRVSAAPPVCNMALLVGDDLQIDVQLPATVPLGEMILDCWDTIAAEMQRRGYEPTESPTDSPGVWSLARVGGMPLDPEQTLDDYGIKDGTLMVLTNTPTTPKFEPMIESAATLVAKTTPTPSASSPRPTRGGRAPGSWQPRPCSAARWRGGRGSSTRRCCRASCSWSSPRSRPPW